jgi:hypothetical protein
MTNACVTVDKSAIEIRLKLKTFLEEQGYKFRNICEKPDWFYVGQRGIFGNSIGKIYIHYNEVTVYTYNKDLKIIKNIFEEFYKQTKTKVDIKVEWSNYSYENEEPNELK